MKYRAEIDGLRALSVLPIIAFHANLETFGGGFVGVDIFFVISGYLITSILMNDLERERFSIENFYARRATRILPALIFMLFFTTFFAVITLTPLQLSEYFKSLASTSIFISNFYFSSQSGYFTPDTEYTYLLHTWSLAVEEQYYLAFPFFLALVWRFGKGAVFGALLLVTIASLALCLIAATSYSDSYYYLTPLRIWELLAGALSACLMRAREVKANNLLSVLGITLIAVPIFVYDQRTPFPSAYTLPPVAGTVLLIVFCHGESLTARILSYKPLVRIGLISYSLYLWHQPILVLLRLIDPAPFIIQHIEWAAITLTFAISIFSYRYIETPFRNKKKHSNQRGKIVSITAATFVAICITALAGLSYGNWLFTDTNLVLMESTKRSNTKSCINPQTLCSPSTKIDVLLLGDSNAYHFSTGLSELAKTYNKRFVNMTLGGCLPLSQLYRLDQKQTTTEKCRSFNANVRNALEHRERQGMIVLSAAWLLYLYGTNLYAEKTAEAGLPPISIINLSDDGKTPLNTARQMEFFRYIDEMITFLVSRTDNLVVVGPIPPALINFSKRSSLLSKTSSERAIFERYYVPFEAEIQKLQKKHHFTYLMPANAICNITTCNVTDAQGYLYGDPTHLSHHGQEVIMKPLLEKALLRASEPLHLE